MRLISSPKLFPTMIIILQTCSAIRCAFDGDWKRVIYFIAADFLLGAVTY